MKNKPIYSKNAPFRICYVANGRWQIQRRVTDAKGTHGGETGHFDPWQPYMRPTDYDTARKQMAVYDSTSNNPN